MTISFASQICRLTLGTALAAMLVAPAPAPATAATSAGEFATRGIGAQSCTDLLAAFAGPDRTIVADQLASWMSGYLSGTSRLSPGLFDALPIQDIYGAATLVLRVCDQNKDILVESAAASIVAGFAGSAPKVASPIQSVGVAPATVDIRGAVLQYAQEALVALDLLPPGSADGVYGKATQEALAAFQTSKSVEPTGLPDAITLFALLFNAK